jgi:hypothetical protein
VIDDADADAGAAVDVGEFCRRVEEHLARVNEGQIIRVVGPAFDLVRGWAIEGVPLSVVTRGIDLKAERHRVGRAARPLRLEFCDVDVRQVYSHWRRSVGLTGPGSHSEVGPDSREPAEKRPSLSRQLDRALDKLSRVAGRLDLPEAFRDAVGLAIRELSDLRDRSRSTRGEARTALVARLSSIDASLIRASREAVGSDVLEQLRRDAEADLSPYRTRLVADIWLRSVDRSIDQLVRDRLGLPTLSFDA